MITVYLIGYNESYLLPQVDKWWRERFDCKFVLYDNESTDGTPEQAKELGWEVISFHTEGMSDKVHMDIKNSCWKTCDTKFCWVSDFDELPGFTENDLPDCAAVICEGWEFIDTAYYIKDAKYAIQTDGYSKMTLFQPALMIDTNYGAGAHHCDPVVRGEVCNKTLPLYHMKWFNPTHALSRAFSLGERQSEDNKQKGWSFHFALPLEDHLNYYQTHFKNRIKIR
jgi:hypothetical protein